MVADVLLRPVRWLARAATGLAALAAAVVLGVGLAAPVSAASAQAAAAPAPASAAPALPAASSAATKAANATTTAAAQRLAPAPAEAAVAPLAIAHEAGRDAVGRWERSATGRRGPPVGE